MEQVHMQFMNKHPELANVVYAKNVFENFKIKPLIGWKLKDMLFSTSAGNIKWLYLYKNVSMERPMAVN